MQTPLSRLTATALPKESLSLRPTFYNNPNLSVLLNSNHLQISERRIDFLYSSCYINCNDIYVNSKIQDDTPLGKLMQDMYCTDPAKLNYKEFAPQMEFLKYSKEGEEEMTDIIELYAEQKAKEATYKEHVETATSLLNAGMSIEFAAQHSRLSLDEVRQIANKLSA